MNDLDLRVDAV